MNDKAYSNAVIYLRVSTKEQAHKGGEAEGYSIPAQRAACLRKAESLGAQVVGEFVDAGESAKNQRPTAAPGYAGPARRGRHPVCYCPQS